MTKRNLDDTYTKAHVIAFTALSHYYQKSHLQKREREAESAEMMYYMGTETAKVTYK